MADLVYLETSFISYLTAAERRPRVEAVCLAACYEPPIICTPDELMGEESPHVDVS